MSGGISVRLSMGFQATTLTSWFRRFLHVLSMAPNRAYVCLHTCAILYTLSFVPLHISKPISPLMLMQGLLALHDYSGASALNVLPWPAADCNQ